jgi:purine-nucleoside/S-methyl-5'-thioadenosine phosphorylase / adenosine deaminase
LATAKQIHSDRVLLVASPGPQGEGDALISNQPGISLAIRTADCLPILIADPRNRAVAAIHAGWRGVVSEIAPKTIRMMRQQFGSQPDDLVIAIGPGIGPCCFEVGPEVAGQFAPFFPELDLSQRTKLDLVETTCRQLGRNGVNLAQVKAAGLCSCCNSQLFESYRRDREASGRMIAMIGAVETR